MSANLEQIRNLFYNLRLASVDFQGHDCLTPLESVELFLLEQQRLRTEKQNLIRRKRANLPWIKTLDSFDFGFQRSVSKERTLKLCDMTWVEQAYNILFLGLPGVGKTHLAPSLALRGLDMACSVAFKTLSSLMTVLKTAGFTAASKRPLQYLYKAALVIVDEAGFQPLEPVEANLFFTFISAMSEKPPSSLLPTRDLKNGPTSWRRNHHRRNSQSSRSSLRDYQHDRQQLSSGTSPLHHAILTFHCYTLWRVLLHFT